MAGAGRPPLGPAGPGQRGWCPRPTASSGRPGSPPATDPTWSSAWGSAGRPRWSRPSWPASRHGGGRPSRLARPRAGGRPVGAVRPDGVLPGHDRRGGRDRTRAAGPTAPWPATGGWTECEPSGSCGPGWRRLGDQAEPALTEPALAHRLLGAVPAGGTAGRLVVDAGPRRRGLRRAAGRPAAGVGQPGCQRHRRRGVDRPRRGAGRRADRRPGRRPRLPPRRVRAGRPGRRATARRSPSWWPTTGEGGSSRSSPRRPGWRPAASSGCSARPQATDPAAVARGFGWEVVEVDGGGIGRRALDPRRSRRPRAAGWWWSGCPTAGPMWPSTTGSTPPSWPKRVGPDVHGWRGPRRTGLGHYAWRCYVIRSTLCRWPPADRPGLRRSNDPPAPDPDELGLGRQARARPGQGHRGLRRGPDRARARSTGRSPAWRSVVSSSRWPRMDRRRPYRITAAGSEALADDRDRHADGSPTSGATRLGLARVHLA